MGNLLTERWQIIDSIRKLKALLSILRVDEVQENVPDILRILPKLFPFSLESGEACGLFF